MKRTTMKRAADTIKPFVPPIMRRAIKPCEKFFRIFLIAPRILTSQIRLTPGFIIIGAPRCGTTSLYNYLIRHPCIAPAFQKEIHFFDINFRKGIAWYRAHFPSFVHRYYVKKIRKQGRFVTGEASPYYIFHPHVPKRISEIMPQVKLIVLLRNPIDRAYSHYHRNVKRGRETLSFEDSIEEEKERLQGEMEKMLNDENYYSLNHRQYSYLSMGIYIDQLKVWLRFFSKEQILILKSENLYNDPPAVFKQVIDFLNLSRWELKEYGNYSPGNYPKMQTHTRERLIEYYKPHNQRLYEYLDVNFSWDR